MSHVLMAVYFLILIIFYIEVEQSYQVQ